MKTTPPAPQQPPAPVRERLLEAARAQLRARPWGEVTMAQVAQGAGVSRQTLYNEFGTRDALGQAVMIREGGRFLDAVEEAIAAHPDDPVAALQAGLERFLRLAETDPFVRMLLGDDGTGGLLPLVTTRSRPLLEWASGRLVASIESRWPQTRAVEIGTLTDALVRLAISHAAAPRQQPEAAAAAVTALLAPTIERMLSEAQAILAS